MIISQVDGYIKKNIGNKYLTFAFTDKNKDIQIFDMKLNILSKQ